MTNKLVDMSERTEQKYVCGWCGHRFVQMVRQANPGGKRQRVSNQVQCGVCKNFMPTW